MAVVLTLEDGSGVTGSNTYVSQDEAVTYATNWGYTSFSSAASQDQINALYYAAFALDKLYGRRYISIIPPVSTQGLLWPRYTIMGNDFKMYGQGSTPQCIKDAQCELAVMFTQGISLFPNETTNRLFKSTSVKMGSLSQTNDYWKIPEDVERYDGFRKVELILFPVLEQANNNGARLTL
jgi:hypothetical protein